MNNRVNAGALKRLLGDGLNLWFGTDGRTFVQVTAADWEGAEKQLDGYLKGENRVGGDAAFAAAQRQLPAKATVWMLIDVVRQAEALNGVVQAAPPVQVPEALKGKAGYAGLAVTLEPGRASLDVYVQAEAAPLVAQGGLP